MGFPIFVFLTLVTLLASPDVRAQQAEAVDVSQGAVAILTDGIANPASPAVQAISELTLHLDKIGDLRILPLLGYGGEANVRDLLKLRGADLALLNSDIFAYLDQVKAYPEARDRIRYVTSLFDQKVFIAAWAEITSIEQLAGKDVVVAGEGSASQITAATIFGLLKIPAKVVALPAGQSLREALEKGAAAVLLLEQDLASLPDASGLHLLPIPAGKEIVHVYTSARIEPSQVPALKLTAPVETVKVITLLATFDWKRTHSRYLPVSRFIGEFFLALPDLRRGSPRSIWLETDVQAKIPDWQRFSVAEIMRATVKLPMPDGSEASLAVKAEPAAAKPPGKTVRLLAMARPPLADQEQSGGGLIAELAATALGLTAKDQSAEPPFEIAWVPTQTEQINRLLNEKDAEAAIAWDHPDCDNPEDLALNSVILCDNMVMSEAIFQSVFALFTRTDSTFDFKDDASVEGRTFCLPEHADLTDLNRNNRGWVSEKKISLVRPQTIVECIGLVEQGKADGVFMHELEGRVALQRLGIAQALRMVDRPVAVLSIHAVAAKANPAGAELIERLNQGLEKLKQTGTYAEIVQKRLSPLWSQIKADLRP
jgi:ABC-type amino acid transport substrate-binding protein